MEGIELLVFILDRGKGDALIKLGAKQGISFSLLIHGEGTASSETLTLLGLEKTEKDVVLLSVQKSRADMMLDMLADEMKLNDDGVGIAFTMPFSALAGQFTSYELFAGTADSGRQKKARAGKNRRKTDE